MRRSLVRRQRINVSYERAGSVRLGGRASGSSGTHRNYYDGGRYVHMATTLPGFDGHIYGVLDISDPERPRLDGSWWFGLGEDYTPETAAKITSGRPAKGMHTPSISLHGGPYIEGDRAY